MIDADKVYTKFCRLNVVEDDIKCQFFYVISIDFLIAFQNKYYKQAYLANCTNRIAKKNKWQIIFTATYLKLTKTRFYKYCKTKESIWSKKLILLEITKANNVWFITNGF